MTNLQYAMHSIERFSFGANRKTWGYAELGFELLELDYSWRDDEISFVLKSDQHGVCELWEIYDVLDIIEYEGEGFTISITDISKKGYPSSQTFEGLSFSDIIGEIKEKTVGYNAAAHTI